MNFHRPVKSFPMVRVGSSSTEASDASEDPVTGFGPDEGLRGSVDLSNVGMDRSFEIVCLLEDTASQALSDRRAMARVDQWVTFFGWLSK